MRITNKRKFKIRIIELLVIIATIVFTILGIDRANVLRGYQAYGGEYLIPVIGLIILLIIEDIYIEIERRKPNGRR